MKWSELELTLKIIKFSVETYALILSMVCQLKLLSCIHHLSCQFRHIPMFNLQKFLSDNNKTKINTDPSLTVLCLFTSDFHESQISPQRIVPGAS